VQCACCPTAYQEVVTMHRGSAPLKSSDMLALYKLDYYYYYYYSCHDLLDSSFIGFIGDITAL